MSKPPDWQLIESLINVGFDCLDADDVQGAHSAGRKLKKLNQPDGYLLIAYAFGKQREWKQAVECLEAGLSVFAHDLSMLELLDTFSWQYAHQSLENGDILTAIRTGKKLEELEDAYGYDVLGRAYSENQQLDKALLVWRKGTSRFPEDSMLWNGQGGCEMDLGKYEEAESSFQRALSCKTRAPSTIYMNLGTLYMKTNQHEKALDTIALITSKRMRILTASARMTVLLKMERYDDLVAEGEKVVKETSIAEIYMTEQCSDFVSVLFHLTMGYFGPGPDIRDRHNARETIDLGLSFDPEDPRLLDLLEDLNDNDAELNP